MASSIVNSAAQQVGNLLAEEAKFLYKVHDKIEKLQIELEWMECFLEDADNRQHQEKLVRKWVAQIIHFAYEAEDVIERYLHEVSYQRGDGIWKTIKWFSNILCTCRVNTLHNLGLDIDKLIVEVFDLNKRLKRYGIQSMRPMESLAYDAMRREERRTYPHVEEEVAGLKNDVQKVEDLLMKTQVNVVSIIGMGGLGKSTLARKVFVDETIKEHFRNNCVWVYISKNFSTRNVFEEILIGLHVSVKDENAMKEIKKKTQEEFVKDEDASKQIKGLTQEELCKKIYDHLQKKACFLVLDDIWNIEAWDSLKPALGSIKRSASKILLTTRNQGWLEYIDAEKCSHPLETLNDEKGWELLQRKAFPQRSTVESSFSTQNQMDQDKLEVNTEKEKLGKEMLKHCGGLPLAIITLGGILSRKRKVDEWKEVLQNISAYLMANVGDGNKDGGILRVLELSYHDLPFYLKPCFLYLANFPEDYEISTERLYHLWEAEGILSISTDVDTQVQGSSTTFDLGERYLLELIQRSMVQVGKRWTKSGRIKTCRVHDLMRDVCIKKCKEVSFLNVEEYSDFDLQSIVTGCCDVEKKMHRCALHVKDDAVSSHLSAQHRGKIPHVRSLLIFLLKKSSGVEFGVKDLANMAKCFPLLRVLDLQDTHIQIKRSAVGKKFVYLARYLSSEKLAFKAWEFGPLIHLRYLSLRKVGIQKLSSHFWDLKYLLTIDLRTSFSMVLPNKFYQMERLRHLYLPRQYEAKDGKKLRFRAHQMETLKNFDPEHCEMADLFEMTGLRIFSIRSWYIFESGDDLKKLGETPVIKSGHLVNSNLHLRIMANVIEEDPKILTSLFDGILTNLGLYGGEYRRAIALHNVESAIKTGIQVFPSSLTKLLVRSCELCREVRLVLEKLPRLQELVLYEVSMGSKISFSDGSFLQLGGLELWFLDELEEWEVGEGALPTLRRLLICMCEKLEKLPDGLSDSVNINCYPCFQFNTCQTSFPAKPKFHELSG